MSLPRVVMCSMWRNDEKRAIVGRVEHLLAKCECYPDMRYVWVVGDSDDGTTQALAALTMGYDNVRIVDIGSTDIEGDDAHSRLRRLSATANEYFHWVDDANYVICHESDIQSPYDLVSKLVAHAEQGRCPIAAWPMIEIMDGHFIFYDVWAYRKDGVRFRHHQPYHDCWRRNEPFTVDSFGTLFMFHAEDAPYLRMETQAVLNLCEVLKVRGRELWVDPSLTVVQPAEFCEARDTRVYP